MTFGIWLVESMKIEVTILFQIGFSLQKLASHISTSEKTTLCISIIINTLGHRLQAQLLPSLEQIS